ncbi:MAG: sulfide:quinone oxidoreductase Sqr [Roseibaca calidilacus]|uniref:Sulfide:quinone oxidoreductase n=2 Tax=Roseibaca calidilacus TaxID=1666912 RepID=A0A0P7WD13_9RHOB|nr:FAD/NAD(P)-binding oxidoreductase [Roseibaca calidilacus]KPP95918.1 MAG: sulfide:quinone oxidoreductase Sqr [Roseibaca calidilacus]CUX81494.1 sulfide:quinone oxidoreductase [Roseibaca calidilacus]
MNRFELGQLSRRGFMTLAAGGAALATTGAATTAQTVKTSARIVILGAGAGGAAIANRLAARLEGAQITVIDGRAEHWYQPGFSLIAAGLQSADYSISQTTDWLPRGINFIADYAAEIDPDASRITTLGGERVDYDYLIVATGLILDWDAIEGFDLNMTGPDTGITAHYAGPEQAAKTWAALDKFTDQGGVALFGRPATEMKCAGAPLKITFLAEDIASRKGNRDKVELIYNAQAPNLFSVPVVDHRVRQLFDDRGVNYRWSHVLKAVDAGARTATFATPEGDVTTAFDFINVIPPQRAPQVVRDSGLSWADKWTDQGWIEVDQKTLRHARYANVFGIGDINGVPKGKTAASVKWHQPVVEDHLISEIQGREGTKTFDGYTSCPLITRIGRAMLVEFDYNDHLVPSFPGVIAPLEELWVSWLMKEVALKATYNAMLRGRA